MRWEGDDRGEGIADATAIAAGPCTMLKMLKVARTPMAAHVFVNRRLLEL